MSEWTSCAGKQVQLVCKLPIKDEQKKKDKAIFVVVLVKANVDQPGVM